MHREQKEIKNRKQSGRMEVPNHKEALAMTEAPKARETSCDVCIAVPTDGCKVCFLALCGWQGGAPV